MFYESVVQDVVNRCLAMDIKPEGKKGNKASGQDSAVSLLIHDVFGGEILKTHYKKEWHFYNRIDGNRIDFTNPESGSSSFDGRFEDIPVNPEEPLKYFAREDYFTFFQRFVRVFEEAVGLDDRNPGYTA